MHIVPVEMSDGDPGYFTHGHVDKSAFVAAVNAEFDEEFDVSDVEHSHQTQVRPFGAPREPEQASEGDNYWWPCKPEDGGAFACTFVHP